VFTVICVSVHKLELLNMWPIKPAANVYFTFDTEMLVVHVMLYIVSDIYVASGSRYPILS